MAANTSRVIELALVFLVTLLSFSIGTYVGKKYSDNQHKLAQLEPNAHQQDEKAVVEADHGTENSHQQEAAATAATETITDEDVAKIAEEFAQEEEPSKNITEVDAHGKPVAVAHTKPPTPSNAPQKVVMAPSKADTDLKREVASISEKAKNIGSTLNYHYTVQVGAYTTTSDAEKMTETLKSRGYKAGYVVADVNGKTYYRVQVGLFTNLDEAQNFKKEVMEKNQLSSAIIQKVSH